MGITVKSRQNKNNDFNKQGATISEFKFYFQGKEIEIVKQYTIYIYTIRKNTTRN